MIQELFYRLIQVNRGTYNGSICVGTCALYRRSALEPFGGTAPIEYSEDVHTGFQIISTGGVIKYLPINLSMGICPEQIKAYFTQQYRWSMGSISLFFSKKFWLAPISALQRICYLSGMFYYITTGLFVLVGPLPSLYLLGFHPEKIMWFNLLASIPSLLYGTVYLYTWTSLGRDEPWYVRAKAVINSLSARHVAYFAHLFAITDYLRGSLEEWKPTNTVNKSSRFAVFKAFYLWHTLFVFLGSVSLVGKALLDGYEPKNFLLILFFIGFNFLVAFNPLKDLLVGERD